MQRIRVIVANEPRAYREVIAAAVAGVRPDVEIITVLPEELEAAVARYAPDLVVCSTECAVAIGSPRTCVSLYPGGESLSVISRGGQRTEVADIQFDTLVSLIDDLSALAA